MPYISIIILTFNSAHHIENLIDSIYKFNKNDNFEILIVDNKSSDETVKKVNIYKAKNKKNTTNLKIFETGSNLGFAKGINFGIQKAEGKIFLFLNPDSVWSEGTLDKMVTVFDRNEKIGIVGGRLKSKQNVYEKSTGKFFGFWVTLALIFGLDEMFGLRGSPEKIKRVDFVSGGFMMVKKTVFEKLSGFDENLFMYVEDMKFCYDAKKSGFLTYFTPEVAIDHEGQGSSDRSFAIKNIYAGILYFHKKNSGFVVYLVIRLLLLLKAGVLVMIGRLFNNKYLVNTYSEAL